MVATHWVEVLAAEASASRSSGIVLECSVTVSGPRARHWHWHLCLVHLWWFEELVRL
jgi:hypothetical protein